MINELYGLSDALDRAKIKKQHWHKNYMQIPQRVPCICITVSDGKVVGISRVGKEKRSILRKYGSNQGSYPCMNLAPLYRITDESVSKELTDIDEHPKKINEAYIRKIKAWCVENNWGEKFRNKYKNSMENIPKELELAASGYQPLQVMLSETQHFVDSSCLHKELERTVWEMLERKQDVSLALSVLFYKTKANKNKHANDEYGKLSVAFESQKLIDFGIPAVSERFVLGVNQRLLDIEADSQTKYENDLVDAFGMPFHDIEEPMPKVTVANGFDITLRTMFEGQPCQTRYGVIGNAGYPLSFQIRMKLKASLEWVGRPEQEHKTWLKIDKDHILFAYASSLPDVPISYTAMFKQSESNESAFSEQAEKFIQQLLKPAEPDADSHAKRISVFVIQKVDKARTKIVYTCQTDPYELEKCSKEWTLGCRNLPKFPFEDPIPLYPLDISDILNCFYKQNKEPNRSNSYKFKPFPLYHGMALLFDPAMSVTADLYRLSENAMNLGPFFGNKCARENFNEAGSEEYKTARDILALMGLFLYRKNIRKDDYMDNLPYLYGQLFKAADELHALYCNVVRNGSVPPQLAGSCLFQSAAEAPVRTLSILSQRIMPYYSWAKSYRLKKADEAGKESWRAGWLCRICEEIMNKLRDSWTSQTRFNDEEKAQLFIGYLANFPTKEDKKNNSEEDTTNE